MLHLQLGKTGAIFHQGAALMQFYGPFGFCWCWIKNHSRVRCWMLIPQNVASNQPITSHHITSPNDPWHLGAKIARSTTYISETGCCCLLLPLPVRSQPTLFELIGLGFHWYSLIPNTCCCLGLSQLSGDQLVNPSFPLGFWPLSRPSQVALSEPLESSSLYQGHLWPRAAVGENAGSSNGFIEKNGGTINFTIID